MDGKRPQEFYRQKKFMDADGFLPASLLGMGHIVGHVATTILGEHRHSNAFEFFYVRKGYHRMVGSGTPQSLSRDTVFVAKPGVSHGGEHRLLRRCDAFWIMVNLERCREDFGRDFAVVADALENIDRMSFPVEPEMGELFQRLVNERVVPPDEFTVPALAATLKSLLSALARNHQALSKAEASRSADDESVGRRILAWVDARLTEDWTVKDAAVATKLKSSRFHELFSAETGYSPIDYRNRRRVEMAKKQLLESDASVTEITFKLGFCSSQYFSVIFRKYEGMSPSQYRRNKRREASN